MTKDQALHILAQAASLTKLTLQEHQTLQQVLMTLKQEAHNPVSENVSNKKEGLSVSN